MLAEMHSERDQYAFKDVIASADQKLVRRHPHVFSDVKIKDEKELRKQWEEIKAREKK